jgi:hypothetical protein
MARDVADIGRGRANKNRHLTESLTPQVGRPTRAGVRIDHDGACEPRHLRHAAEPRRIRRDRDTAVTVTVT